MVYVTETVIIHCTDSMFSFKEQHLMTQLQDLGLLSFTPSRDVKGQRINSYDDRYTICLED